MSNQSLESTPNNNRSPGGIASISMIPLTVVIAPDEHQIVQVQVTNESSIVEHYRVTVEGLSPGWITLSQGDVRLMPNQNASFNITIGPLPTSARAGAYPFRIILQSTADPRLEGYAFGILHVRPATAFTIDLSPSRIRNSAQARLRLTNAGNLKQRFSISGSDPEDRVIVHPAEPSVRVDAGEEVHVALDVEPVARPFTGKTYTLPFAVDVSPEQGAPKSAEGKLEVAPLIPRWLLTVLLMFMATTFGIGACSLSRLRQAARDELAGFATATVVAEDSFNATATAYYGEWDLDNDGLSYEQEIRLGTDPTNPDHDGDGLNDGQEVVVTGTDPLKIDTDEDTLSDWEEVNSNPNARGIANGQRTNPLRDDTDNDGLLDHIDSNTSEVEVIIVDPQNMIEDPSFEEATLPWRNRFDRSQIKTNVVLPVGWKLMLLDDVPAPESPDGAHYAFPEMKQIAITQMSECTGGRFEPICEIFVNQKALTIFKDGHPLRAAIYREFVLEPGVYEFRIHYFADAYNTNREQKVWAESRSEAAQLQLCVESGEYDHQDWVKVPIKQVQEATLKFIVPETTEATVYVNLKNPLSLKNNGWFFDDWSLKRIEEYNDNTGRKPANHGCEADMGAKLTN